MSRPPRYIAEKCSTQPSSPRPLRGGLAACFSVELTRHTHQQWVQMYPLPYYAEYFRSTDSKAFLDACGLLTCGWGEGRGPWAHFRPGYRKSSGRPPARRRCRHPLLCVCVQTVGYILADEPSIPRRADGRGHLLSDRAIIHIAHRHPFILWVINKLQRIEVDFASVHQLEQRSSDRSLPCFQEGSKFAEFYFIAAPHRIVLNMSGGVVRLIEQRKKTNAYYDSMNATIADRKRTQQIATFEVSTTKKIERKMKEVWHGD